MIDAAGQDNDAKANSAGSGCYWQRLPGCDKELRWVKDGRESITVERVRESWSVDRQGCRRRRH